MSRLRFIEINKRLKKVSIKIPTVLKRVRKMSKYSSNQGLISNGKKYVKVSSLFQTLKIPPRSFCTIRRVVFLPGDHSSATILIYVTAQEHHNYHHQFSKPGRDFDSHIFPNILNSIWNWSSGRIEIVFYVHLNDTTLLICNTDHLENIERGNDF